ncbi:MAG: transposase family protein [Iphinoe sp. HA4291-MV1]|nr:transposase family protein [Iphinoe sp. HA4291-MV1]
MEKLSLIKDFRASRGRRYPLWLILLLVLMGTMSGCIGYQALEDFACRHHPALVQQLQLKATSFPSDSTFRRVISCPVNCL